MNSPQTDESAFVNDHIEPTVDFDWEIVEPEHRESVEVEIRRQCSISLAKFSRRLLEMGGRNHKQFFIAANCLAFAAHIHPDQERSGEQIARRLRLTKAAFFKRVNQWRDVLRLPRIAGARSEDARKIFRKTAKQNHEKKKIHYQDKPAGDFLSRLNGAH